jgi:hypothetical protein
MTHIRKFKSNYVAIARNVETGKVVRISLTTRDEVNSIRWYEGPHNTGSGYVLLKIVKG